MEVSRGQPLGTTRDHGGPLVGSWRNTLATGFTAFLKAVESHGCPVEKKGGDRRLAPWAQQGGGGRKKEQACTLLGL